MSEYNNDYKKIFDMALYGTIANHPDWGAGAQVYGGLEKYFGSIHNKNRNISKFCSHFSSRDSLYGLQLRDTLYDYGKKNDFDLALGTLDLLKDFCADMINSNTLSGSGLTSEQQLNVLKFYTNYLSIVKSMDSSLESQKEFVYNNIGELNILLPYVESVADLYYSKLNKREVYDFPEIEIVDQTKTADQVLCNNDEFGLKNSYGGRLLDGRISLESNRGYINNPYRVQQDSVLSIAKSDDCFLNIVADGVGSDKYGQEASKEITETFKAWFGSLSEEQLKAISVEDLCRYIDVTLLDINNYLVRKYEDDAASTVVLALTSSDKTVIANVGDSTAYAYDSFNDKLIELTTLDSLSYGMSYEEARHNPRNNIITNSIGHKLRRNGTRMAHFNIIPNNGERIILSSDGVTDLVSEERFKSYFIRKSEAREIVDDAVYRPDIDSGTKKSDNVSAIVIDLPGLNKNQSYVKDRMNYAIDQEKNRGRGRK